jgi:hypothetical protein
MASKKRNILLFIDNCSAHPKNVARLPDVRVEFFASKHDLSCSANGPGCDQCCELPVPEVACWKDLLLIKIDLGAKNLNNFRLSVLDAIHFLTALWDLISAAVISNCFSKVCFSEAVNEGDEIDNHMESIDEGTWATLQQDLNFTCSFDDFVEIDDDVLPCGLISIDKLCDESSEVKDTNETSEESVL